jgi:hypothetical protein
LLTELQNKNIKKATGFLSVVFFRAADFFLKGKGEKPSGLP